ncbi:GLPGLI family protein [Flavobacterium sp.]|uniref:GLPGLI family protein n=1 Tax=Flavobacterium sp. TaxID=239 RepID=UPI00286E1D7D|nr:GLPGLI family protein [Flavobacterium sp.]
MNKFKLFFVFLITSFCFAQNATDKGVVLYIQIESPHIGGKNGPAEKSSLVFNKLESSYATRKDSLNNLIAPESKDSYENKDGSVVVMNMGNLMSYKHGFQVYTSLKKDTVWSSWSWDKFAYVKEKKATINWKLLAETKKIGNFECHKAKAFFRGREYTAWYTNEIPVPFGPWKLQGLPGLILEAYDTDEKFYFCMRKLEYPTQNPTPISKIMLEAGKKWFTVKEYFDWCDNNLLKVYEKGILLGVDMVKDSKEDLFKEFME